MKKIALFFILIPGLVFSSVASFTIGTTSASAQTSSASVQNIQRQEFKGEVLKVEGGKLTVDDNGTTKEFTVPSGIRVTKNTLESSLGEIQANDKVTITYSGDNQVLAVDATAGEVSDIAKFAVPALLLALLLIGLIYYFVKKSKQGHIKTTTTNVSN